MFVTFVCITYFASQICVNLTSDTFRVSWEKKGDELCIFSWNHVVSVFDILNEHDGIHQFSCQFCAFLTRGYAKETLLDIAKLETIILNFPPQFCVIKIIKNYCKAHWHIRPQSDDEQGINKLPPYTKKSCLYLRFQAKKYYLMLTWRLFSLDQIWETITMIIFEDLWTDLSIYKISPSRHLPSQS